MTETLIAAGAGLVGTLVFGRLLLPALRRLKLGQKILEIGPSWHKSKEGTPTMGGLFFMLAVTAVVTAMGWNEMKSGQYAHLFILLFAWIYGAVGVIDDLAKVRNKRNQGLSALQKLLLQLSAAAAFLALTRTAGYTTTDIAIPFTQFIIPAPWAVYITAGILFVAGFVNAVNLTDGVDGLCTGVTLPVAVFFTLLALRMENGGVAVFAGALAGAMLGFLVFNFHPARVFMGDTGSLFIGGALCGIAFALDRPLLLIITGFVYIIEMLSVVLQVTYFKLTKGKRLFKMSPIHHHFEMSGWKERKIFVVFTLTTTLLCVIAWLGA